MPRAERTSRRARSAWLWTHSDQPLAARERVAARIARTVAKWNLIRALAIGGAAGVLVHEIVYHWTGNTEFPLTVIFNGTRVFVMSHGGLDALGEGSILLLLAVLIDRGVRYAGGER